MRFFCQTVGDPQESISPVAGREANRAIIEQDECVSSPEMDAHAGRSPSRRTAHGERRTGNGERGTANGERARARARARLGPGTPNPELQTPNPTNLRQGGYERSLRLGRNLPKTPEKKKIEPNAPPKATRKSSIALKTLSSLKSSPAATKPIPRKTRLAPAWRTIWRTLRTFFGVLADDSGQGFQSP